MDVYVRDTYLPLLRDRRSATLTDELYAAHKRLERMVRLAIASRDNANVLAVNLPIEVLWQIFVEIPWGKHLHDIARVSKVWMDAILANRTLRKRVREYMQYGCGCPGVRFAPRSDELLESQGCVRSASASHPFMILRRARSPTAGLVRLKLELSGRECVDAVELHGVLVAAPQLVHVALSLFTLTLRAADDPDRVPRIEELLVPRAHGALTRFTMARVRSRVSLASGCRQHGCMLMCHFTSTASAMALKLSCDDANDVALRCVFAGGLLDATRRDARQSGACLLLEHARVGVSGSGRRLEPSIVVDGPNVVRALHAMRDAGGLFVNLVRLVIDARVHLDPTLAAAYLNGETVPLRCVTRLLIWSSPNVRQNRKWSIGIGRGPVGVNTSEFCALTHVTIWALESFVPDDVRTVVRAYCPIGPLELLTIYVHGSAHRMDPRVFLMSDTSLANRVVVRRPLPTPVTTYEDLF